VVACDEVGAAKFLLDVAKVVGTDLADAETGQDDVTLWRVDLTFGSAGADKWNALTREAFDNAGSAWSSGPGTAGVPENPNCIATQPSTTDGRHVCMVAVVLDNEIVTTPAIQGVLSTSSQITGQFTEAGAQLLANQLKYGALPVALEIVSVAVEG
jgi:preprotein translocase subunit SecD